MLNAHPKILFFAANSMWIKHRLDGAQLNRHRSGSLSKAERLDYINAVKCLRSLPARTPSSVAPGARSRVCSFRPLN